LAEIGRGVFRFGVAASFRHLAGGKSRPSKAFVVRRRHHNHQTRIGVDLAG
jgi:hypothetical protein